MASAQNWRAGWRAAPAYAAAACAFVFAVPSLYWALGGTSGRSTIGSEAVTLSWAHDPAIMTLVLATGVLKITGGLLALAMVQAWGQRFPRRPMALAGWGGATVLLLYGGVQGGLQILIATDVIRPPADFDWGAFYWHLYLWSPWFLVWGITLGLATWFYQHRHDDRRTSDETEPAATT